MSKVFCSSVLCKRNTNNSLFYYDDVNSVWASSFWRTRVSIWLLWLMETRWTSFNNIILYIIFLLYKYLSWMWCLTWTFREDFCESSCADVKNQHCHFRMTENKLGRVQVEFETTTALQRCWEKVCCAKLFEHVQNSSDKTVRASNRHEEHWEPHRRLFTN